MDGIREKVEATIEQMLDRAETVIASDPDEAGTLARASAALIQAATVAGWVEPASDAPSLSDGGRALLAGILRMLEGGLDTGGTVGLVDFAPAYFGTEEFMAAATELRLLAGLDA